VNDKILVVDDEPLVALTTSKIMEKKGYRTAACYRGSEAVSHVREDKEILLVLMDVELGTGMDGIETAEAILSIKNIPIVFLTNFSDARSLERAQKVHNYGYVLKDSGEFILVETVSMALTHYKERRNQEKAQHELQYHADLLEQISEAVVATDVNLHIISWNRAAEDIYGWSKEEAVGKQVDELLDTQFLATSQKEAQRILALKGRWRGELKQRRKNGEGVYIEAIVTPVRDKNGSITGGVTVNRDITEKLHLQKRLELQRDMLVHINTLFGIEDVAGAMLDYTLSLSSVEGGALYLRDEEKGGLQLFVHRGLGPVLVDRVGFFPDNDPLLHTLTGDQRTRFGTFTDFFADSRYKDLSDFFNAFALIPLIQEGVLIGTINFWAHSHGKFSAVDKTFMEAIGPWIGDIIQKRRSEEKVYKINTELECQKKELEEVNTTLKVLLKNLDNEKKEKAESLREHLRFLVMPLVEGLEKIVSGERTAQLVSVLHTNLDTLLKEGSSKRRVQYGELTPKELQVVYLMRENKKSKEIADILGISVHSVFLHRKNIRRKFGLSGSGKNLTSYLKD